jgi:hypothetical protein
MKRFIILLIAITIITLAIFFTCKQEKKLHLNAPVSWFENPTTEAPSDEIPFNNIDVSDTAFHFWSWQKFLSLTRSPLKAPFENLIQVDNYGNKIGSLIELNDSTQAGSDAVLYDKSNRSIYYTIHFSEQMFEFQQMYQNIFVDIIDRYKNTPNRDMEVQKELKSKGLDTLTFPVGTFILKTSWILASSLKNEKDYYITKGVLPSSTSKDTVDIALVGMHIIGRVLNHPEFIWATYEHYGLAPNYSWSHKGYPTLGEVISENNYLFYNSNTNFNGCPMNNVPCSPAQFSDVFNIYPYGTVKSFTSNEYPNKKDIKNLDYITSLDKSVKEHLNKKGEVWKNYFYKGSVWLSAKNSTFRPGFNNIGNLENISLAGARAISNISMETYTQLFFSGDYTQGSMNCFGCHTTVDFMNIETNGDSLSYNLALSHAFRNGVNYKLNKQTKK